MNLGDLVRYAIFPHERLHKSGMTGLVISEPYTERATGNLHLVDVMWSKKRLPDWENLNIACEYADELEVINESMIP